MPCGFRTAGMGNGSTNRASWLVSSNGSDCAAAGAASTCSKGGILAAAAAPNKLRCCRKCLLVVLIHPLVRSSLKGEDCEQMNSHRRGLFICSRQGCCKFTQNADAGGKVLMQM